MIKKTLALSLGMVVFSAVYAAEYPIGKPASILDGGS